MNWISLLKLPEILALGCPHISNTHKFTKSFKVGSFYIFFNFLVLGLCLLTTLKQNTVKLQECNTFFINFISVTILSVYFSILIFDIQISMRYLSKI